MNSTNKKEPAARKLIPSNRAGGPGSEGKLVPAQLKSGVVQRRPQPIAPLVYRPLPLPRVLQKKEGNPAGLPIVRREHKAVGPPPYRMQPMPKVSQMKSGLTPAIKGPTPRVDSLNRATIRPGAVWGKTTVQLSNKNPDKKKEPEAPKSPPKKAIGPSFSCDGKSYTEETLKDFIKDVLGNANPASISQAINDIYSNKEKATSKDGKKLTYGDKDVKHASAGQKGKNNGCSLFFTKDAAGNIELVAIGQHTGPKSYAISWGKERVGKTLNLD